MRFPVTLDVKPSRRLRAALVFVHLLAFGGLLAVLPTWAGAVLAPLLALSLWRGFVALRGVRLTLGSDARIELVLTDGPRVGEVLADSAVFRWLAVLRIRLESEQRVRAVVVLTDSVPLADFRRLQVWLRWILPFRKRADAG